MAETMLKDSGHCWDETGERCLRCGDKDWFADEMCSKINKPVKDYEIYCPICRHIIEASNIREVEEGEHDSYIFVHDDMPHDDNDTEALSHGIN